MERERGMEKEGDQVQQPGGQSSTKGRVTAVSGLYREEPLGKERPRLWTGEFRVDGGVCKPHPVIGGN